MKQAKKIFSLLLAAVCTFSLCACTAPWKETPVSKNGFYLDTIITITLYGRKKEDVIDHCFDIAKKYESLFSTTVEGSDIWNINHANQQFVSVSDDTLELINDGIFYSSLSGGAFDITVGALSSLWDFDHNEGTVPSADAIEQARETVGWQAIEINGNKVRLNREGTQIDLGGIAKGFIADKMKEYLLSAGITSGIINLGGNVLTLGTLPDGSNYSVGIQKPFSDSGTAAKTLSVNDKSVVTSGTYQRYFEKDGVLYHHILDLSTGYPCSNSLSSVTIVSDSSTEGDALSTITFLLGEEQGKAFIESLDGIEAVFITEDGTISTTSGLK